MYNEAGEEVEFSKLTIEEISEKYEIDKELVLYVLKLAGAIYLSTGYRSKKLFKNIKSNNVKYLFNKDKFEKLLQGKLQKEKDLSNLENAKEVQIKTHIIRDKNLLLDSKDACRFLKICRKSLYNIVKSGKLRITKKTNIIKCVPKNLFSIMDLQNYFNTGDCYEKTILENDI
jgi:hypothetical protein